MRILGWIQTGVVLFSLLFHGSPDSKDRIEERADAGASGVAIILEFPLEGGDAGSWRSLVVEPHRRGFGGLPPRLGPSHGPEVLDDGGSGECVAPAAHDPGGARALRVLVRVAAVRLVHWLVDESQGNQAPTETLHLPRAYSP